MKNRMDSEMRVSDEIQLKKGLHQFPAGAFGLRNDLIHSEDVREPDTLMIACSELGADPDYLSFASSNRFVTIQHLAGSMPSRHECQVYDGLSCSAVEKLFEKYDFRHVILCGHLGSKVIPYWLHPRSNDNSDSGYFRRRFELRTRRLVDSHYSPKSGEDRCRLMIFEHVLCQIENMLSHTFVMKRVFTKKTSFYGWVADKHSARVYGYDPAKSSFGLI